MKNKWGEFLQSLGNSVHIGHIPFMQKAYEAGWQEQEEKIKELKEENLKLKFILKIPKGKKILTYHQANRVVTVREDENE